MSGFKILEMLADSINIPFLKNRYNCNKFQFFLYMSKVVCTNLYCSVLGQNKKGFHQWINLWLGEGQTSL